MSGALRRLGAEGAAGLGLVLLLVLGAFPDVAFRGRTLTTAASGQAIHPGGIAPDGWSVGGRNVIDPGASTWCDEPYLVLNRAALAEGSVPLWNPGSACGMPLLGDQLSAPFYPLNALLYLLPAGFRWDAFLIARLFTAGLFTLLFLRLHRLPLHAAFLGAAAHVLTGHLVLYVNINHLNVDVLHPAMFYAVERLVRGGGVGWLVAVTATVLYGGSPEPALFVLVLGGVYLLVRASEKGSGPFSAAEKGPDPFSLLVRYALGSLAGFALAAPFLLPFAEFLRHGASLHHMWPIGLNAWDPKTAITLLAPRFFSFGGSGLTALQLAACTVAPYVGIVLVFLAGLGVRGAGRLRWLFLGILAFYVLKAYGAPWVNDVGLLPLLRLCFFHKYLFPAFAFALSCLAAWGAAALAEGRVGWRAALVAWLVPAGVVVGWRFRWPAGSTVEIYGAAATAAGLGAVKLFLLLPPLVFALARRLRRRPALATLPALAAVLGELLSYVPRDHALRPDPAAVPPFVQALRDDGAGVPGRGRVFATDWYLTPNWSAALGFEDPCVQDVMTIRVYHEFVRALLESRADPDRWIASDWGLYDPLDRWLRFLNVRWLVSEQPWRPWLPARILRRGLRFTRSPDACEIVRPDRIALRAPGEARTGFPVPERGATLSFQPAVAGDVVAEVAVREAAPLHQLFLESIDPKHHPPHRGWLARRVDLSAWAGREVAILLTTAPGANSSSDWAGFADLRVGGAPVDVEAIVRSPTCGVEQPHFLAARTVETPDGARPLLFLHPFGFAEFTARVPAGRPELTFRIGLQPEVHHPDLGDGVDFHVALAPRTEETVLWTGAAGEPPLSAARIDLARWAGREMEFVLRARGAGGTATLAQLCVDGDPPLFPPLFRGPPAVHRSHDPLPRAFVVHRAEVAASDPDGLRRLGEPGFDPARRVLLHESEPASRLEVPGAPERDGCRARVTGHRRHAVEVTAELEHPGWLVLSEAFYPGWSAEVDGKPAPLRRANHAFRAVWLEAGRHEVRFRYRPLWWRVGLAIAGVAAAALLAAAGARRRRGR
jgi:hypothetical protein